MPELDKWLLIVIETACRVTDCNLTEHYELG
jgi:hypothetical protein